MWAVGAKDGQGGERPRAVVLSDGKAPLEGKGREPQLNAKVRERESTEREKRRPS